MISVGSKDEKKELSLRYDIAGGNMGITTKYEEGGACFQSNYDDDPTIDPEISLSYIDEKLENLLGHCRKDFEGGFTAENLGAKFGDYGSFLPTYKRSPVGPHLKTPSKVVTHSAPVSPNNVHIEGKSTNGESKQEVTTSRGSDQKSLKVRLKVGPDNLSRRVKAEIYSGLGLDVSPSSSSEASPLNEQIESPTSILEIMTSFPVMGNLVSPLPYDILHLMEKEKGSQESSVTALHGSDFSKVDQDVLGDLSDTAKEESVKPAVPINEKIPNPLLPLKTDSDVSTGSKIFDRGVIKAVKQKDAQKAMKLGPNKTSSSSSGSKRRLKGVPMDNAIKKESFTVKRKNDEDHKKISGKAVDTYKDFFGELDLEHDNDDDEMGLEKPSVGNNEKKSQKPSSLVYEGVATMGNGLGSDVGATMVAPVVNEDWVCCDKCEKWRLLPPGINPGCLPEKWLCSMLDWVPGMNRCSITEEETTKAITSRFSVQGSHPDGTHTHTHQHQHISSQIPVIKNGLKDVPNEAKHEKPSMSSNSSKKNLHSHTTEYRSKSLTGRPVNGIEFQDSGQSRDMVAEKGGQKQKENKSQNLVDQGNKNHHSNKRERGQDFPKDYKKVKTDVDEGKFDKRDIAKKRKRADEIDAEGTPKYAKETSETNSRKEKKSKTLKPEDEGITTRKVKNIEDVKMRSVNVRKDTAMAATSSSSKVSGLIKSKTNNQEAKGSPVGSVSSAPLRSSNNNKRVDESSTKNVTLRPCEEKSKEGRNKLASEHDKTRGQSKNRRHDNSSQVRIDNDLKKDVVGKEKSKSSLPPRAQNNVSLKHNDKKAQSKNGNQPTNVKHPTPDTQKGKEQDGTVVLSRELSNQATTNALREATNLKHMADRVKNGGSSLESRALYMQAALKFLHVASVFESCHKASGRFGDMIQSKSIYSSTAKLCEYCAHEYERTNEMTTAALAYKCMEVAYMKVINSSHVTASKDVNELHSSLQMDPTGSSSSSGSASDLDNLICPTKGVHKVDTPQVIPAKLKPNFTRILNFANDVNFAMEASRKSRIAFETCGLKEESCLSVIKSALDYNFHDVEGLLHRVRVAMEVINK